MCDALDCNAETAWRFDVTGPPGTHEVVVGLLVEPGDTLSLCYEHLTQFAAECLARPDASVELNE